MRIGQHLAILFCLLVTLHLAFAAIPNPALMKNSPIKLSEKQYLSIWPKLSGGGILKGSSRSEVRI